MKAQTMASGRRNIERFAPVFAALVSMTLLVPVGAIGETKRVSLFASEDRKPTIVGHKWKSPQSVIEETGEPSLSRMARVDFGGLDEIRDAVLSTQQATLRLNLFHDVEFEATIERSTPTLSGYTLSGPLPEVPFGRIVLVVNGEHALGRVYTPENLYVIRTTGTMQTVERRELVPLRCATKAPSDDSNPQEGVMASAYSAHPDPLADEPMSERADSAVSKRSGLAEKSSNPTTTQTATDEVVDVVDVLVVYPSFARYAEGGYEPMLALIELDVATANEAFAASGVDMRVELVAAVEVEYDWFLEERFSHDSNISLWYDALDHLAGKDDGYLDGVHQLRDRFAADLVLMHLGGETSATAYDLYGISGIAAGVYDVSTKVLEESGFSIALSGDGITVAHELGHTMGLLHDRYDDVGNEPFPYSHGFVYEHTAPRPELGPDAYYNRAVYGTIMATYAGVGSSGYVLAFSDPNRSHPQDPDLKLGVPGDEPSFEPDGPADSVRHLNEVRAILSNVRARTDADRCRYGISGHGEMLPADGGTYRIHVETGADCTWTVSSGEWVESVSETHGAGSSEIEITVGANDGWERPIEVLVSGQLHSRRQAGSRPITPVCERSGSIQARLNSFHPDKHIGGITRTCRELEFDASFLASFRTLLYPGQNVGGIDGLGLTVGDLDGLTGLVELEFENVGAVPPDVFSGLFGLRVLTFEPHVTDESTLREIVPGAFRGLSGLVRLTVHGHLVEEFRAGVFDGMPRLLSLEVRGKGAWEQRERPSTAFDLKTFSGLSRLLSLRIVQHRLNPLRTGIFDELDTLRKLQLSNNSLSALPEGVFAQSSKLEYLLLDNNDLSELPMGVFNGLSSLVHLGLHQNRISKLEPGVFGELANLQILSLFENRLKHIPQKAIAGLRELEWLELTRNRLSDLEPGSFAGLSSLRTLGLNENGITAITPGAFEGLTNLYEIFLGGNGLRSLSPGVFEGLDRVRRLSLWGNDLGRIPMGAFDGVDDLLELNLRQSGVTSLEPGVFDGKSVLSRMTLQGNRLREFGPAALRGVRLYDFDMRDNPGTPFTFAPTPVALPVSEPASDRPMEIVVEMAAAPFEVIASLSASGGTLSHGDVRIAPGTIRADTAVTVTPDGEDPVTVQVDGRPTVVSHLARCNTRGLVGLTSGFCYRGVRVAAGAPLVLYGIDNREMTLGRGAASIDLVGVFSYFLGNAEFSASSNDESVAGVTVEGGTLTVTPRARGTATVAVSAIGADGETRTRQFEVKVRIPSVPHFLSDSDSRREGFVRLINRSAEAGTVRITAIDDSGVRNGPITMRVSGNSVVHFNSGDLENGNAVKGLPDGIGNGKGDWRLEFESALDIEALAYVRTRDGFLTSMHDVVPSRKASHGVAIFNPASNMLQASVLRVINPGTEATEVTVRGVDDAGLTPGNAVKFTIPAGAARMFTAQQLEMGAAGQVGALGDGSGKWRLAVEANTAIEVMSLLENVSTGHLTNLSSAPVAPHVDGVHHVPLFPAASDPLGRQGFARVINRSGRGGTIRIVAYDDGGNRFAPLELSIGGGEATHFNSEDLELGNAAKGLSGGTGPGSGNWRLELTSDVEIGVLSFIRMEDGFLTSMHDAVATVDGQRQVLMLNPGSNANQVSRLRLVNPTAREIEVAIHGTDDTGWSSDRAARVDVPAGGAQTLTSVELEAGAPSELFEGFWSRWPLGDGVGKWRLSVVTEEPVRVMSLLESPTGHLTNISSAPD